MALTTAPLLSMRASGQIGKTLVYGTWKGRAYARSHVVPANPQTAAQTNNRKLMAFLVASHKTEPANLHQDQEAVGNIWGRITGLNSYVKSNIANLKVATTCDALQFLHGANGGLAIPSLAVTPGSGSLAVTVGLVALPPGWVYNYTVLDIMEDQDPHDKWAGIWEEAKLTGATTTHTFSTLGTGKKFQIGAYASYVQPNGMVSLSPSFQIQGTTS